MRGRRRSIPARRHFPGAGHPPDFFHAHPNPNLCAYCKRILDNDRLYVKCEECSAAASAAAAPPGNPNLPDTSDDAAASIGADGNGASAISISNASNGAHANDAADGPTHQHQHQHKHLHKHTQVAVTFCVDCFSVGAAILPHLSTHSYSIVERYSLLDGYAFDWSMKEEIDLLDAMAKYGPLDWKIISTQVATKSEQKCRDHYHTVYLNHPDAPLPKPDLATATTARKRRRVSVSPLEITSPCTSRSRLTTPSIPSPSPSPMPPSTPTPDNTTITEDSPEKEPDTPRAARAKSRSVRKAVSDESHPGEHNIDNHGKKNSMKHEECESDTGKNNIHNIHNHGKKNGTKHKQVEGYVDKRGEFEVEFDNEAEDAIAYLEILSTDTKEERDLKIRLLELYNERLTVRENMKTSILQGMDESDDGTDMYIRTEAQKKTDAITKILNKKKNGNQGNSNSRKKPSKAQEAQRRRREAERIAKIKALATADERRFRRRNTPRKGREIIHPGAPHSPDGDEDEDS